jgi:hypothetical protein
MSAAYDSPKMLVPHGKIAKKGNIICARFIIRVHQAMRIRIVCLCHTDFLCPYIHLTNKTIIALHLSEFYISPLLR